jgi:hypothetical protein
MDDERLEPGTAPALALRLFNNRKGTTAADVIQQIVSRTAPPSPQQLAMSSVEFRAAALSSCDNHPSLLRSLLRHGWTGRRLRRGVGPLNGSWDDW